MPTSSRLRLLVLAALVPLAGACLEPLESPNGRFGSVTIQAFPAGTPGNYTMRPEGGFYGNTNLRYQQFSSDTCLLLTYTDSSFGTLPRTLDAGEFLVTTVSGRQDTLTYVPVSSGVILYRATSTSIAFTPGDTFSIVIPGAPTGFPASSARVRTAEAFTHDPVAVPAEGQPLPITWTAAPAPGSSMTFSLRYANSFSTGDVNEQVYCSFVDDGAATIPANLLQGWVNATNGERETQARRVRSNIVQVDARTQLALISYFSVPLPGTVVVE